MVNSSPSTNSAPLADAASPSDAAPLADAASPAGAGTATEASAPVAAAFDELVAEYLSAIQQGDARPDEYWIAKAGADALQMRAFLSDHRGLQSLAGIAAPRADTLPHIVDAMAADGARDLANSPSLPARDPYSTFVPCDRARDLGNSPSLPAGTAIVGDYELLGEIARGGMGIVFRARHRFLRREVALKMILAGPWAATDDIARFQAEARAAAQFDHIGIVPVYEFGQHGGLYYYTMALIDGPSLAEHIRQGPVAPRQAAAIMRRVAEGVAHAHSKGVVHRDLKPANVLLARRATSQPPVALTTASIGELLPFDPRVSDFGLAKQPAGDAGLTATGQAVGTPSYMSPEQAAGRLGEVGAASDIYALGAVLYELLTGRPPFRTDSVLETLRQVCENPPAPPRLLNAAIPVDLETICLRCLEKEPGQRYASAQAVADDLGRFLAGDAIHARSVNVMYRVARALGKLRHTEEFEGWGQAIALAGLIVFATHLAIFALDTLSTNRLVSYWIPKTLMFSSLLLTLAAYRRRALLPANSAERLVWALWGALFSGLISASVFVWAMGLPHHHSYALSAMFGGFCFFVIGSHLWGGCYALGGLFFAAAPWIAMSPRTAPLWDGLLWCLALCTLGVHYRNRRAIASR